MSHFVVNGLTFNFQSRDEEESAAYSLDLFGNHVTESEIQTLLRRIPQLKSKAAALAQSALVLRLCGKVLERDVENKEERTALVNQVIHKTKIITLSNNILTSRLSYP